LQISSGITNTTPPSSPSGSMKMRDSMAIRKTKWKDYSSN
jgi:hypothetical protein